jgi:hypothetical protein
MKKLAIVLLLFIISFNVHIIAQDVFYSINNTQVYAFLDELALQHFIEINDVVKPWSRKLIAEKLNEALLQKDKLSKGQQQQLDFFLRDFNKDLLPAKSFKKRIDLYSYKDSVFNFTVNPVGGFTYYVNNADKMYRQYAGGEFWATLGKHLSMYASFRDITDSRVVADDQYRNDEPGFNYKYLRVTNPKSKGGSFDETRGAIIYSFKWGSFGIIKDNLVWGTNYHGSNIISNKAPSFARINLHLKPTNWLEFNYFHAWLNSEVLNDSAAYISGPMNEKRKVYFAKYFAANMFTVTPFKKFNFSFGNSIVYSDQLELACFIPFMEFKSLDHSKTGQGSNYSGQNSQLFFNISSRNIKYVHLYTSLFIDEISLGRAFNKEKQSNFLSFKIGSAVSLPFSPTSTFIVEYTRSNPIAYRHFVETTTYASNKFTLGNYLIDNAQEIYLGIKTRPFPKLYAEAGFTQAAIGPAYAYTGKDQSGLGLPFLKTKEYESTSVKVSLRFEIINDICINAGVLMQENKGAMASTYTAPFYYGKNGKTATLFGGFNIGF